MNKFLAQDIRALSQVMDIFGDWYTIIRAKVNKYNDSGRYEPVEVKEKIFCLIQEDSRSTNLHGNGHGEGIREDCFLTLTCVKPNYVNPGDIIETERFGRLRVTNQRGNTQMDGATTHSLVRTGTANEKKNDIDYVY